MTDQQPTLPTNEQEHPYAAGRRIEREGIVNWLRAIKASQYQWTSEECAAVFADAIEKGDHAREPDRGTE